MAYLYFSAPLIPLALSFRNGDEVLPFASVCLQIIKAPLGQRSCWKPLCFHYFFIYWSCQAIHCALMHATMLHGMSLWWYLSETSSSQLSYGICHLLRELSTELYKSKEKDKQQSVSSGRENWAWKNLSSFTYVWQREKKKKLQVIPLCLKAFHVCLHPSLSLFTIPICLPFLVWSNHRHTAICPFGNRNKPMLLKNVSERSSSLLPAETE